MVECEVNVAHIDPFGAPRVRSDSWRCLVRELSHECYADNMASRIAIDIGVDADEGELGQVDSGLLPDFATAGGHNSFADLHETAWQCMFPRARFMPTANEQYAIGADAYREMLHVGEAVELSLERLLALAEVDLARNQAEFKVVAHKIAPGKSPAEVMRDMAHHHPSAHELIPTAQKVMENLRAFILERDLVSVPADLAPTIAETPGFLRWAFAMMDTPGAFEKVATEAFYYITPPEKNWPEVKVEEWLTAFNYSMLESTSAHEGWPGHYLHWLHFRNSPTEVTKALEAYTFSEGWAHYVEQMMVEEGYRESEPYFHLAQLAEALPRDVRFICAIGLHTQGMSVDEAARHFMNDAYMEELPARKEAERGTFDPGYLAYTLGKLMVLKLRRDYKSEQYTAFSLKRFHDTFLSFGAPPIPLVRKMMLHHDDGQII